MSFSSGDPETDAAHVAEHLKRQAAKEKREETLPSGMSPTDERPHVPECHIHCDTSMAAHYCSNVCTCPPSETPREKIARLERERDVAQARVANLERGLKRVGLSFHPSPLGPEATWVLPRPEVLERVEALTQAADTLAEALRKVLVATDHAPEAHFMDYMARAVTEVRAALSSWDALKEKP